MRKIELTRSGVPFRHGEVRVKSKRLPMRCPNCYDRSLKDEINS